MPDELSPSLGNLSQQPSWQNQPPPPQQRTSLGQTYTGQHAGIGEMAQQWQQQQPHAYTPGMGMSQYIQASGGINKSLDEAARYGMGFSPAQLKMARFGLPEEGIQQYMLMNEAGKNAGEFQTEFIHPDRVHVHWMKNFDERFSHNDIDALLPELKREYPNVRMVTGQRISGARAGPAEQARTDNYWRQPPVKRGNWTLWPGGRFQYDVPESVIAAQPHEYSGHYFNQPTYKGGQYTPGEWLPWPQELPANAARSQTSPRDIAYRPTPIGEVPPPPEFNPAQTEQQMRMQRLGDIGTHFEDFLRRTRPRAPRSPRLPEPDE